MQQTMPRLMPNPSVVAATLDNETVLLDVESGLYFGLDEIGSLIWSMLANPTDEAAIVTAITSQYDANPVQVDSDVRSFIDTLAAKNLLVRTDG